jgi:hypothetical protein
MASCKIMWRLLKKSVPEEGVLSNIWWFKAFIAKELFGVSRLKDCIHYITYNKLCFVVLVADDKL